MELLTNIMEKINTADMVLVGVGEEFEVPVQKIITTSSLYQSQLSLIGSLNEEERYVVESAIYQKELKGLTNSFLCEQVAVYDKLQNIIADKNYFVVSVCNDDVIRCSSLDRGRITTPRGSRTHLECSAGCGAALLEAETVYQDILDKLERDYLTKEELTVAIPKCKECGAEMKPNLFDSEHYSEEGYQPSWQRYSKWLSGTLNKNLCILELGAGFTYPSLMRWPFERVTMLNQKATLIRVHNMIPQVEKEIAEKSFAVKMSAKEFIMEVSNGKANECK